MEISTMIIIGLILVIALLIIGYCIRVIPQSNAYVIERLGAYSHTLDKGMHLILPFVDRVANRVSLKERVQDFAPQPVITKDNVTMQIDTVIYFQITDPVLFTYGIHNPINAIENLTATTLRNIIGDLELDQTLTSRDIINSQMRAERERRESILRAEGEKRSAILIAEGENEAAILRAQAKKAAMIAEAEGEAEAIDKILTAQASAALKLETISADNAYIKLKSLEALEKVADGKATKIIVPSELQNMASLLASAKEIMKSDN